MLDLELPVQARIALLEGERRSFENVKLDLMRRIKMLEYALRVERYVNRGLPTSVFPSNVPSLSKLETIDPIDLSRRTNDKVQCFAWSEGREGGQRRELPTKRRCVSHSSALIPNANFPSPRLRFTTGTDTRWSTEWEPTLKPQQPTEHMGWCTPTERPAGYEPPHQTTSWS